MDHPLIGSLSDLTVDELSTKLSELNKKMVIAQKSGNGHLCDQIRMAINSYQNQYQKKTDEIYRKHTNSDFSDKINIE
jgi:hypothetical protein